VAYIIILYVDDKTVNLRAWYESFHY